MALTLPSSNGASYHTARPTNIQLNVRQCVDFPYCTHFLIVALFYCSPFLSSSRTSTEDLHRPLQLSLRPGLRTLKTTFSSTQACCHLSLNSTSIWPALWRPASISHFLWSDQQTLTLPLIWTIKRARTTLSYTSTTTPRPTLTATIVTRSRATGTAARLAHLLLIPLLAIPLKWTRVGARRAPLSRPNLAKRISRRALLVSRSLKSQLVAGESQTVMTRFAAL